MTDQAPAPRVRLTTIAREWGRMGLIGFGGPPAHIALLRRLCVDERAWLTEHEFEDGIAVTNLLPGPGSTQLAVFCAWRLRGRAGAIVGGTCFIVPGLVIILALSSVFLATDPPLWILGAAAGLGAAVPAVAVSAAIGLIPGSWRRTGSSRAKRTRWLLYVLVGAVAAATVGPFLVVLLVGSGLVEVAAHRRRQIGSGLFALGPVATAPCGGRPRGTRLGGAEGRSPVLRRRVRDHPPDAERRDERLPLDDPGAVPQRGRPRADHPGTGGADRRRGRLRRRRDRRRSARALVAFTPSFVFVIAGGPHFDRLRANASVRAFLTGAGAAAIGAIAGASISLALALSQPWQVPLLALAAVWLVAMRRSVVTGLLAAGAIGIVAVLAGAPVTH